MANFIIGTTWSLVADRIECRGVPKSGDVDVGYVLIRKSKYYRGLLKKNKEWREKQHLWVNAN